MTVINPGTLRQLVTRSDAHPALAVPESGVSLSYDALQHALDRATGRLAALGVVEGDRVALLAANGPALVVTFLALAARGAAAAPLNPALGVAEVTAELTDLRVSRLLHDGSATATAAAAAANVPASTIRLEGASLHVAGQPGEPIEGVGAPEALALLLHTSGTTSKPKTVPIKQRNIVASTGAVARTYGLTGEDVTMCVMPLFHVHGLVAAVLATLSTGGTVLLPRFRPSAFWADVAKHGATWYTAVPTIHQRLLTRALDLPAPPAHRLRFVRSCSAPLPATRSPSSPTISRVRSSMPRAPSMRPDSTAATSFDSAPRCATCTSIDSSTSPMPASTASSGPGSSGSSGQTGVPPTRVPPPRARRAATIAPAETPR